MDGDREWMEGVWGWRVGGGWREDGEGEGMEDGEEREWRVDGEGEREMGQRMEER